jgi:glycosyltransferase involved in cell wall biosynthesis
MKVCIFPNDPIIAYLEKGEIKERYFNPNNIFDEIHIISFIDKDVEVEKVQKIAGNAKLIIHSVGKINIKNRKKEILKILEIVKKINPNIIRTYNSLIQGWCAAWISKELDIPFFVSLHTQYDYNRQLIKMKNLKKFLALKYSEKFIEPFVLQNADKIIIVYKIIEPYVLKHTCTQPELLYNKVDCKKFFNAKVINGLNKPLILSIGNLIDSKNHKLLIQSMNNINANLLIIGKGELQKELEDEIKSNRLENKVSIIESVTYDKIPEYYKSADVFALAYDPKQEGLPMPVMEAMSAGIPVVIPKSLDSEELVDAVQFSERNVEGFCKAINQLLENTELKEKFIVKGLQKAQKFDITKLETRESEIYKELIKR